MELVEIQQDRPPFLDSRFIYTFEWYLDSR